MGYGAKNSNFTIFCKNLISLIIQKIEFLLKIPISLEEHDRNIPRHKIHVGFIPSRQRSIPRIVQALIRGYHGPQKLAIILTWNLYFNHFGYSCCIPFTLTVLLSMRQRPVSFTENQGKNPPKPGLAVWKFSYEVIFLVNWSMT